MTSAWKWSADKLHPDHAELLCRVVEPVAVMGPFDVVALAGDALDRCRQRMQQDTCGHRGRIGDPRHGIRRVLCTGVSLLTDRQHAQLTSVFAADEQAAVVVTWGVYRRTVFACRQPDRRVGKTELSAAIKTITHGVLAGLPELRRFGRTLKRRAADVPAYFDRPGTSKGPTEATNGRREHLRSATLGCGDLTNCITRSLLAFAQLTSNYRLQWPECDDCRCCRGLRQADASPGVALPGQAGPQSSGQSWPGGRRGRGWCYCPWR